MVRFIAESLSNSTVITTSNTTAAIATKIKCKPFEQNFNFKKIKEGDLPQTKAFLNPHNSSMDQKT